MSWSAKSTVVRAADSFEAGRALVREVRDGLGAEPSALLVYATVNHDARALLAGVGEAAPAAKVVGCSSQGLIGNGLALEDGYIAGAMGFAGDLRVATTAARELTAATGEKGEAMGRELAAAAPELVVVFYDALGGADVDQMLGGLRRHLRCPVVGGGAGQPFGRAAKTYQYFGAEVLGGSAVALALGGGLRVGVGTSHGMSPTGVVMRVTKVEGTRILELDGRRAVDVWSEVTGCTDFANMHDIVAWGVGVKREGGYVMCVVASLDEKSGAIQVQAAVPEGVEVMFHHRTVPAVVDGAVGMARELRGRLGGRPVKAALAFECGARTSPFLGRAETLRENVALQRELAPEAPWLGTMAWGEIAALGGEPCVMSYTYSLVALGD
ncbi:MAG TPA: FIST N-terminal domain-containing protein [Polyangiaceae bacterium]|nr:FIST N-terminal domain-containing protein [Polyangiaceae bacterium]